MYVTTQTRDAYIQSRYITVKLTFNELENNSMFYDRYK